MNVLPETDGKVVTMQQMEYRLEQIQLTGSASREELIVGQLNRFGKEGWRVTGIDLAGHPAWVDRTTVTVLLERPLATATPTAERELTGAARS